MNYKGYKNVVEEFVRVMDLLSMRAGLTPQEIADYLNPVGDMARDALEEDLNTPNLVNVIPSTINAGDQAIGFAEFVYREVVLDRQYEKCFPVPNDAVVVDLGANVGMFPYSLYVYGDRSIQHVYCVEPSPSMVAALRENIEQLPFPVTVGEYALTDTDGERGLTADDLLCGTRPMVMTTKSFKTFIKENGIDHIDFLKIDVEGAEYKIFTEENYEFLTNNVDYIVGEWHLSAIEDGVNKWIDFRNLYLAGRTKPFWVFEARGSKDVTEVIMDDDYVRAFHNWWHPRGQYAQLMVYMDNKGG